MSNNMAPNWENVLSSAARLQRILPDAVLVGGTASAVYAKHRLSTDADHVLIDPRERFDQVLAELETVQVEFLGQTITVPTQGEILRIKGCTDSEAQCHS